MLSWLPLIGPIIQGLSSGFSALMNKEVVQMQTESATTIAETNASVQIIQATNDDIALRVMRDMACLPVVAWMSLMTWDTIMAKHYPGLVWHTAGFPDSVSYIPFMVLTFIFGNIGLNMWKRR